jgi:DNA-binding CsgD family transcriptional regulator
MRTADQTCRNGFKPAMLRRLKDVALPFIQATDADQVLETLDAVASPLIRVLAVAPLHLVKRDEEAGEAIIFHPDVPAGYRADHKAEIKRQGRVSQIVPYAREHPAPFTLTEAMRRLQPTGRDRWIFDLLRDHGIRDGLYCTHWPWIVTYNSDHVLKGSEVSDEVRRALDIAAGMAVARLKEIIRPPEPAPAAELSPRELTVLLHLSDGLSVGEIADRLVLSETSVKTFVRRATKKLNASSQLHAVSLALKSQLI